MGWAVVIVLVLVNVAVVVAYRRRRRSVVRRTAENLLKLFRDAFSATHEVRIATDLTDEMRSYLDEAADELGELGFVAICDVEDLSASAAAGRAVPMRCFAKTDEEIGACAYYLPTVGRLILEVGCDLSDGRTIKTTTSEETAGLERRPGVFQQHVPWDTTIADMLSAHRKQLADVLAAGPPGSPTVPRTAQAVLDDFRRSQTLNHEFRKRIGWVTLSELKALAEGDERQAESVYREIERSLRRVAAGD
jgi:hypothetical protein